LHDPNASGPADTLGAAYAEFQQLLAESSALIEDAGTKAIGLRATAISVISCRSDSISTSPEQGDIPSFTRLITRIGSGPWRHRTPCTTGPLTRVLHLSHLGYPRNLRRACLRHLSGDDRLDDRSAAPGARIADHQLIVDEDGRFEIIVSAQHHEGTGSRSIQT